MNQADSEHYEPIYATLYQIVKVQHSWMLWLVVKNLLLLLFAIEYFAKTKFHWAIS